MEDEMGFSRSLLLRGAFLLMGGLWVGTYTLTWVEAAPQGPQVLRGDVSINQPNSHYLEIQASDNSIINFDSFNIASPETVRFLQPHQQARVLARVTGSGASQIDGHLLSNGQLYLVNPMGIFFGRSAVVDVGGLFAAAGSMSNQSFLNGSNFFTDLQASVINRGLIRASAIHLLGKEAANIGSIVATDGFVSMVSGKDVLIGDRQGRIFIRVQPHSRDPGSLDGIGVNNEGQIEAGKGEVFLSSGDIFATAIRSAGRVSASKITVEGSGDALVEVLGELDASSQEDGQHGGEIHVLGDRVGLYGATLDASGPGGGGSIKVGGDFKGLGDLKLASATHVDAGTVLRADATQDGNGGKIIVWGENWTRFDGLVSSQGRGPGTYGGFAEISGKQGLYWNGEANLKSADGQLGTLLLDPNLVTVVDGVGPDDGDLPDLSDASHPGVSLTIGTTGLAALVGAVNLIIESTTNIEFDPIASNGGVISIPIDSSGSITFSADNDIFFNDVSNSIQTAGSGISMTTTTGNINIGALDTGTGSINLSAGNDLSFSTLTGSAVDLTANTAMSGGAIQFTGDITSSTGDIVFDGDVDLSGGADQTLNAIAGTVTVNGDLCKTGGGLLEFQGLSLDTNGDMENETGSINVASTNSVFIGGDWLSDDAAVPTVLAAGPTWTFDGTGIQILEVGGSLTVDAPLTVPTSSLALQAEEGGLVVNQPIDLQSPTADLSFVGDTTINDLQLLIPNSFTVNGNITLNGSATTITSENSFMEFFENVSHASGGDIILNASTNNPGTGTPLIIGGDVTTAGAIQFNSNTELNGGRDQTINSTGSTFTAMDLVSIGQGDITIDSASNTIGSVNLVDLGILTLNGPTISNNTLPDGNSLLCAEAIQINGPLTAVGSLAAKQITLAGDCTFTGTGDTTLDSDTGSLVTGSGVNIEKTTGSDLIITGNFADFGGDIINSVGSLQISQDFSSEGNLSALGVDLSGTATLDGTGNQSIDAGTGTLSTGNVSKTTAGNLNLTGTSIQFTDDMTALTGDIVFNGDVELSGGADQTINAIAGTVTVNGDLSKTGGGLLEFQGLSLDTNGDMENETGSINVASTNSVFIGGDWLSDDPAVATVLAAGPTWTFDGTGGQTIDVGSSSLTLDAPVTVTNANFSLRGLAGIFVNQPIDLQSSTANLSFHHDTTVTGHQLLIPNIFQTDGDLILNGSATTITTNNGTIRLSGDLSHASGGDIILNGFVNNTGSNAGIILAGDVTTTGAIQFNSFTEFNLVGAQLVQSIGNTFTAMDLNSFGGGSLTIDSSLNTVGSVSVSSGDMIINGPTIANNALSGGNSLVCSDTIQVNGTLTAVGSVASKGITLGGDCTFTGTGSTTLDSGSGGVVTGPGVTVKKTTGSDLIVIGSSADFGGDITNSVGSLQISQDFSSEGNLSAIGVDLSGTATLDGTGNQSIDAGTGTLSVGNVNKTTAGNLNFNGNEIEMNGKAQGTSVSLSAAGSIQATVATPVLQATSQGGDIDITSCDGVATTVENISTASGDIAFTATDGATHTFELVETMNGSISITADGDIITNPSLASGQKIATNGSGTVSIVTTAGGDIYLGFIEAIGNSVLINAAGNIEDTQDDRILDIRQGSGNIPPIVPLTLTAGGSIGGAALQGNTVDPNGDIELYSGNLTTNAGSGIVNVSNPAPRDLVGSNDRGLLLNPALYDLREIVKIFNDGFSDPRGVYLSLATALSSPSLDSLRRLFLESFGGGDETANLLYTFQKLTPEVLAGAKKELGEIYEASIANGASSLRDNLQSFDAETGLDENARIALEMLKLGNQIQLPAYQNALQQIRPEGMSQEDFQNLIQTMGEIGQNQGGTEVSEQQQDPTPTQKLNKEVGGEPTRRSKSIRIEDLEKSLGLQGPFLT